MSQDAEWRCTECSKLLGVLQHKRIHLRFAGGHQYLVALPVSTVCRRCGVLNEAPEELVSRRSHGTHG